MAEDKKKTVQKDDAIKPAKKKINKILIMLILCAAVLGIVLGGYYMDPEGKSKFPLNSMFHTIEQTSITWRFNTKALTGFHSAEGAKVVKTSEKEGVYQKIVIAGITGETLAQLGEWPFDRKYHAQLLENLNSQTNEKNPVNKRFVFFDILFGVKGNPESDQALIEAVQNYNGPIGEDFILDNSTVQKIEAVDEQAAMEHEYNKLLTESLDYNSNIVQGIKKFELDPEKNIHLSYDDLSKIPTYDKAYLIIPEIVDNLTFCGPANIDTQFGLSRKYPLVIRALYYLLTYETDQDGQMTAVIEKKYVYYPSILLSMAIQLMDAEIGDIQVEKGKITIKDATYNGEKMDFTIPVDDSFRLAINYKATENDEYIKVLPFHDVMNGGVSANSIILVGMFAKGAKAVQDVKMSPLGNMFGILHIAYALGTIMNRDYIISVPHWVNILYTAILSVIVAMLISRGTRFTVLAGLVSIVVPLGVGFTLFMFNIEILTLVPLVSTVMTLIAGEIFLLLTEEKEKRFIKSTFSSYVNPAVVDILIQHPEKMKLGGDSKELTIMFSDIRGFTSISEGMTPEYLINFLNDYLSEQTDIVMETGGTLDKYIGDAVMAFWGAPIDMPDHALKGCQAAIKMMEALHDFNVSRQAKGDKPIDIGIGLNTAVVNVGNVGSNQRKNYTVIGDGVNLASRLEATNKVYHTNIIITEETYEKIKDYALVRELDYIAVKGKKEPVKIFELIDIKKRD
ncbi:MAG: hypothetical protein A2Y33_14610 [Spirochaetes bacterium GWF1_51_8]|nr:MAG: hypothetical protein A2Y33_14610 [Spirochaetes bacterium GWF1_51_8]